MLRTRVQPVHLKPSQHRRLDDLLHQLTDLWNGALEERIGAYRRAGETISYYDQRKSLTIIRGEDESFRRFSVHAQRSPLHRLDRAFKAFFRRVQAGEKPGFPRFKSRHRGVHSFEVGNPTIRRKGKRYTLSVKGIGDIRFATMPGGVVRQARIVRTSLRTSVHLVMELPDGAAAGASTPVGIDVGINRRVALSTGASYPGVRVDRRRIRRMQKLLSRARKGSNARTKKRGRLAKAHERVRMAERNALHRLTTAIVRQHRRIAVEDLRIPNMVRNRHLSKRIHEQQWGRLVQQLTYKAASAGGEVVRVDPKRTSMACSDCGHVQPMPLCVREFRCGNCGLSLDRDVNAAANILNRASAVAGWDIAAAPAPETVAAARRPGASGDRAYRHAAAVAGQDAETHIGLQDSHQAVG